MSGSRTAVVRNPLVPNKDGEQEETRRHRRHEIKIRCERAPSEEMCSGIEGGKGKGDDPAQKKLEEDVVNGQGVATEGEHVEDRRHDAHAVLEPESDR